MKNKTCLKPPIRIAYIEKKGSPCGLMILMAILQVYNREIHMVVLVSGRFMWFSNILWYGICRRYGEFLNVLSGKERDDKWGQGSCKAKTMTAFAFFLGEV
jgi:hypothetical protein